MASVLQVATIKDQGGNANAIEIANSSANVTIGNLTATTAAINGGSIGSNVTIADGANPHGWEHIKTISYSANTNTPQKMSNVVSSTYSAYKIILQWGSDDTNGDLYFRFLDSSDAEITGNEYSYGITGIAENGTEGLRFNSTANTAAQIANDALTGGRGFNAEMTLYNCFASSSDFPQIDGYQLTSTDASPRIGQPHATFHHVGHDSGNFDLGTFGFFWYDSTIYPSGFQLYWNGNNYVSKGSWWSCYGLKLPTAD